ncbi:hypothetical protein DACRYDRAFT_106478 [Dacryopinax primogenitus]|uniref:Uncharacterized protein n=1 Tax=Dacryopinax primogenitus (strain DJM 731) TaxID=1858805 RepID=M5G3R9_DACPD|nr:uncharacterized protein DACRYDRAFT_106478 [Dacryopinax primogenitus]EJU03319.1 hypothetical protein DACRYDRAFT_106478 [Dacryopinax primogenitus]
MTRFNTGYSVLYPCWRGTLPDPEEDTQVADYATYMDLYAYEEQKTLFPPRQKQFDPQAQDSVIYAPDKAVDLTAMWARLEREEELAEPCYFSGTADSSFSLSNEDSLEYLFSESGDDAMDEDQDFLLHDLLNDTEYMAACQNLSSAPPLSSAGDLSASSIQDMMVVEVLLDSDYIGDQTMVDSDPDGLSPSGSSGSSGTLLSALASPFVPSFLKSAGGEKHGAQFLNQVNYALTSGEYEDFPHGFSLSCSTDYSALPTPEEASFPKFLTHEYDGIHDSATSLFKSLPQSSPPRIPGMKSARIKSMGVSLSDVPVLSSPEKSHLGARRSARKISTGPVF